MYNPPFAGKKGRLFSQEHQRRYPRGSFPLSIGSLIPSRIGSPIRYSNPSRILYSILTPIRSSILWSNLSRILSRILS
jgi:hypothetical protein